MQKPVLGRGLGNLLGGDKVVSSADSHALGAPVPAKVPGHGVKSLLRGGAKFDRACSTPTSEAPEKPLIPRFYLFAADILLVALALLLTFKSNSPLNWKETTFCIGAILVGGCCGMAGALMGKEPDA
jgi:hypothetical protein